jgi:hypothetical protein
MTTETASEDDNFGTEQGQKIITRMLGVDRRNRVLAGPSSFRCFFEQCSGSRAHSKELTRRPPELLQHFSYIGGVHIGARALHVLNFIWFG